MSIEKHSNVGGETLESVLSRTDPEVLVTVSEELDLELAKMGEEPKFDDRLSEGGKLAVKYFAATRTLEIIDSILGDEIELAQPNTNN
jgi:hypothetical protein